jgi:N-acetylneuraminate synthase
MMNTKFIAEISSNHNRDIQRAKALIATAAQIGCAGVKFQLFKIEALFSPEILSKSKVHRKRKKWELPIEFIPELSEYTRQLGLQFSCTPFYLNAVDILLPHVDFYKIASYELLWKDLFLKISATQKPIVFATGMATLDEIDCALNWLSDAKSKDITILHCSSAYPTPIKEANLKALVKIKKISQKYGDKLNIRLGWSDHTVSPAVIYRAIYKYDVEMVEFHLDLDGKGEEYQAGHCWLPREMETVIQTVQEGIEADGSGVKEPMPAELADRAWRADPADGLRPLKNVRLHFGRFR